MRVALDTNRLTDLFRGEPEIAEQLSFCDEVWIPLAVLGEIKAGFHGGGQRHRNEIHLQRMLAKPGIGVMLPTRETAEHYARLFVQLKRAGTPISDNDIWIAAQALEHELVLLTRDRHFKKIPQLALG